ncbi:hypothetical protein [Aulosira sp. FACHB-615]|uniref:hypothetical protein n=1 Tax=Aulosira sp. FACHB-615 TaxID=2692777 RepID=UPI0016853C0B|nr:hypothetical protein [Aulosira sp. FACHB-615]MBD2492636.1 hypothetical protein [Aulosira sp. FACHB-615]
MIYTSCYAGQIRGEAVSISLHPPTTLKGKHSLVFASTPEQRKVVEVFWTECVDALRLVEDIAQEQYKRE